MQSRLVQHHVQGKWVGAQLIYGSGESRYFALNTANRFVNPPGEFGSLEIVVGAGYRYTSEFGESWTFDINNRLTQITDRNGLVTSLGYTGDTLSSVTAIDGFVVSISAVNGAIEVNESNGRRVTLAGAAGGAVQSITFTDGTLTQARSFTYTNGLSETWGTQVTSYQYGASGRVNQFQLGTGFGSTYPVTAAVEWGLSAQAAPVSPDQVRGSVADPFTHTTTYEVDPLGRLGMTKFADDSFTVAARNKHGLVTAFTDERGFTTRYAHDARGHTIGVARPDGGRAAFEYDHKYGQLLWAADSYGAKTKYEYYANSPDLKSVTDPLKNVTAYTYHDGNRRGLVATVSDPRNPLWLTQYAYDVANRRLTQVTDADGNKTGYLYDGANGFGNVTSVTDPLTRVSTTEYDGLNRLRKSTDVFGAETSWTYDAQGRVLTETDALDVVTKSEYDSRGLVTQVTEALDKGLARATWFEYDAATNLTVVWNPREYDKGSALAGTNEPHWNKVVTEYDTRNRPILVTEGAAYEAGAGKTKAGTPATSALSRTTRTGYDKAGNALWVETGPTYATAETTNYTSYRDIYEYDNVGRVAKVTIGAKGERATPNPYTGWEPDLQAKGRTSTTKYDLNGNAERITANDGTVTTVKYDKLDRPLWTTEALGTQDERKTGTDYDKAGNVLWTTDGNGVKTGYGYDKRNLLTTVTEAADTAVQRTTLYEYDAVGRLTWEWAPREFGYESPLALMFPALNRIGTHTTYDDNLHTTTVTEAASVPTLIGVPALPHTAPQTVTWYDKLGRATLVTDPLGRTARTIYDFLGRAGTTQTNEPAAAGGLYLSKVTRAFDAADNVRTESRLGVGSSIADGGTGEQTVTDQFAYDVHNRRINTKYAVSDTSINAPAVTRTKYDALDRVLWEFDPNWNATGYTYSPFGEVVTMREGGTKQTDENQEPTNYLRVTDSTYDATGQLEKVTTDRFTAGQTGTGPARVTTAYGYDKLGRRTSVTEAAGVTSHERTTRLTYDGEDRPLTTVEPLSVSAVGTVWMAGVSIPIVKVETRTTRNLYDELGRVVSVIEADGIPGWSRTTRMGYDAADNLVWEATPRQYDTDPVGTANPTLVDLVTIPAAKAAVTLHAHDALDRRTRTVTAINGANDLGHAPPVTEWVYDVVGRVEREVLPADAGLPANAAGTAANTNAPSRPAVEYAYDNRDRVLTTTEGRWLATGTFEGIRQAKLAYDGFGRVTKQVSGKMLGSPGLTDDKVIFKRLQETQFTYDALGQLRWEREFLPVPDMVGSSPSLARVTWADYDGAGNRVLVAVADNNTKNIDNSLLQSDDEFLKTRRTHFTFDPLGRMTVRTDAWAADSAKATLVGKSLGHASPQTKYEYDAFDQVLAVTDPRGVKSVTEYDLLGRKVREVLGKDLGSVPPANFVPTERIFGYDPGDRVVRVEVPGVWVVDPQTGGSAIGSVVSEFRYDPLDRRVRQIDGAGTAVARHTITTHDAADNLTSVTQGYSPTDALATADGKTLSSYSKFVTTLYTSDPLGRVKRIESGRILTASQLASAERVPLNTSEALAFDASGYGHSQPWTKFEYAASGQTTRVRTNISTLATADTVTQTTSEYDLLGRVYATNEGVSADGKTAEVRRRTQLYDSLDAVVGFVQLGDATWTRVDYDGLLTKQISGMPDPRNKAGSEAADKLYKANGWQGPLYTNVTRNIFGEVEVQSDQTGPGNTVSNKYDLLGRVQSQVKKAALEEVKYTYDLAGNVEKVEDTVYPMWYDANKTVQGPFKNDPTHGTVGRTTSQYFGYDALNRVVSATDTYWSEAAKSGHTTHTRYDALGRVEAVWARDGKVRWFGYDAVGRQVQEIWTASAKVPDKELTAGAGNALGRPVSADGATVLMSYYDAADRVRYAFQASNLTVATSEAKTSVSVTPAAGTTWSVNPYTQTRFEYDGLGRVKTETPQEKTETTPGLSLSYWYDAAGRVVQVSDSQQGWQATEYDRAGRVTARVLSDDGKGKGAHFQFEYRKGAGYSEDRVKTILGRSGTTKAGAVDIQAKLSYDALGREVEREWDDPALPNHKEWLITRYADNGLVLTETRRGAPTIGNWADRSVQYHYDGFNQVLRQDTIESPDPNSAVLHEGTETKRDAAGNGVYLTQAKATEPGNRVSAVGTEYGIWYDDQSSGGTATAGNVTQVSRVVSAGAAAAIWTYEYDHRNRLVSATQKQQPWTARVEYAYDTFDRLVGRAKSKGTTTDPNAVWTRYLYAGDQPYADATAAGTITLRYLFGPDGTPLARLTGGSSGPQFYLTDRQNSVLQMTDDKGTTLKRVEYEGLQVPANKRLGSASSDRFELGGQRYDPTTQLSMLSGSWFHPGLGRNLTESGRGIGLNPYPVAENNAPNELPSYNGTIETGLNAAERYLGASWNHPGKVGRGTVNGFTIGISEWIRQDLMGDDRSKWTLGEQRALDTGEGVGTGASLFLGYGVVGRGVGLGAKFGVRAVQGATALERGQKAFRASYTATATWRGVQLGAEGIHNNATNPYLKRAAGYARVGAGFMKAFSSLGMAGRAVGTVGGALGAPGRAAVALGGFGLLVDAGDSLYKMWSNDRVSSWDKWTATAEFAGGLAGGLFRGRTFREAAHAGEFSAVYGRVPSWLPLIGGTRPGLAWRNARWGAGEYLSQVAHNHSASLWARVPAWTAARAAGFRTCFAPGTPLRTPEGWRYIEDIRVGDWVLSRDEFNLEGPVEAKVVEEVFVREGLLWYVDANGRRIRTTAEHPFFVAGKGWVACQELQVGDKLATESGAWVTVERVEDTGVWSTVYNLRVADYHTYFVGQDEWGFSVWAHNATDGYILDAHVENLAKNWDKAWSGKIVELHKTVVELAAYAMRRAYAEWGQDAFGARAETIFQNALTRMKRALDKHESKYNVEYQPAAVNGRKVAAFFASGDVRPTGPRTRLDAAITLLPPGQRAIGARPRDLQARYGTSLPGTIVRGYDLSLNDGSLVRGVPTKPYVEFAYTVNFRPSQQIFDVRLSGGTDIVRWYQQLKPDGSGGYILVNPGIQIRLPF